MPTRALISSACEPSSRLVTRACCSVIISCRTATLFRTATENGRVTGMSACRGAGPGQVTAGHGRELRRGNAGHPGPLGGLGGGELGGDVRVAADQPAEPRLLRRYGPARFAQQCQLRYLAAGHIVTQRPLLCLVCLEQRAGR